MPEPSHVHEHRSERIWAPLLLGLLICVFAAAGRAQVLYGSLTGNVTDPTGAAIAKSKVEALNTQTGVLQATETDATGVYRFSVLQAGVYKITISSTGFAAKVFETVPIDVNIVRRIDAQLAVAAQQEVINVSAESAVLQTEKADLHTDLKARDINDLPITSSVGGRNFQSLLRIVPGFGYLQEANSAGANPQRSMNTNVNGQSTQGINTRIDGAQDAYPWLPANVAYVPPADAVEAVNVVTNSFDPEQGMAGGAAVNVQIKSGTNQFHGTAFEYHNDQNLRARNYFKTDLTRFPTKARENKNQFGGAFGGPILKDKLFFFGDFQRTTQRQLAQATKTLPTAAMRNGDFSATGINIYDPATTNASGARQQFSCNGVLNVICPGRIDPAAAKLVALMPNLTTPSANTNNYVAKGTGLLNVNVFDVKLNYVPSAKSMLFGRYSMSQSHIYDPPSFGNDLGGDATAGGQLGNSDGRIQSIGLGATYSFTPNLLIDWNFGFTRQRLGATAPDIKSAYGLETLGIPGTNSAMTSGDPTMYNGVPSFIVCPSGSTCDANTGNAFGNPNTGNPFLFRDNQYVTGANTSWNHGKHAFRVGIEYNHTQMNHFQPQGSDGSFTTARGSFNFNGNPTTLNNSAAAQNPYNSFAQFLLGLPQRAGKATLSFNPVALRWSQWAWYARDQWQVNPRLTLTLGLRWEFYPFGYSDNGNGLAVFNPKDGNVYIGGNGGIPLDSGVDVGNGQFLPRVGVAYRITNNTVIRAGYGMSADPNNFHFLRNAYPSTITSDSGTSTGRLPIVSLTGTNKAGNYGANGAAVTLPVGITSVIVPIPDISSGVVPLPTGAGTRTFANPFRRGYINSYNLTLQQQIVGFVVEAGYVASRGIRPLTNVDLNGAPICPATVQPYTGPNCKAAGYGEPLTTSLGRSVASVSTMMPFKNNYYDALQTKLTRRFAGSSQIGAVYTYSKAINYSENEDLSGLFEHNPSVQYFDKALASFDRPHNFQLWGAYDLPFGADKKWAHEGVAKWLAGGWQINGTISRLSGTPFNLGGSAATLNPNSARGLNQTVDLISSFHVLGGKPWSGAGSCALTDLSCHYFDPGVFAQPTNGRFGTVGRNTFRGPGIFDASMSVFRNFKVTERVSFQFRAEAFGLTNTPRFSNPNTSCAAAPGIVCNGAGVSSTNNFGTITSTLGTSGSNASTDGTRTIWLAGRITF